MLAKPGLTGRADCPPFESLVGVRVPVSVSVSVTALNCRFGTYRPGLQNLPVGSDACLPLSLEFVAVEFTPNY